MISNLITSLLVACAVGGTTASAFDDKPKLANSESREQYQIQVTENILDETNDWDSITDYGEAAPYYQTTDTIDGYTIYNKYWTKQFGYYSENKWEVVNRTYIKMTSAQKDNFTTNSYTGSYTVFESISLTQIKVYRNLIHIDSNSPMQINRIAIQDQDEVTITSATGSQSLEKRIQSGQNNTIDNFIVGQTPPNLAYQYDSIGYIYNQIKPYTQLVNTDTYNYSNDEDDDYLGSDHLNFSYNYDEIMTTDYIITYTKWDSSNITWNQDEGQGRPNIDIQSKLTRIREKVDITYTEMVYIDSQGGTTPVITQEIIDIPSIMYTVMTMPFAFISQAFNLTLFPNTPYQVNFANIFLVILALLIILFVVKIVMRFIR